MANVCHTSRYRQSSLQITSNINSVSDTLNLRNLLLAFCSTEPKWLVRVRLARLSKTNQKINSSRPITSDSWEAISKASNIPQQHFNQFGSHGGSINPSDLTMGGNGVAIPNGGYASSFQNNNFTAQASNPNSSFSKGISTFNDDELLDSLGDDERLAH